jgi:sugar lactone lactonase YvrE
MKTHVRGLTAGILVLGILSVLGAGLAACGAKKESAPGSAVVTTLAGGPVSRDYLAGTGPGEHFGGLYAIACDAAGNLYVTDEGTIRRITPAEIVLTLAGKANHYGTTDGTGSTARFKSPMGIAADSAGNLYVADSYSNTIRKVTPAGKVSTLAGKAAWFGTIGYPGSADGRGSAARFRNPEGVACDAAGNVYVADMGNATIRKITPAGVVTPVAGKAGHHAIVDGTGSTARFYGPDAIVIDSAGNLYVTDQPTIRKITPAGVVTTLAGQAGSGGSVDGTGSSAQFLTPQGIACDPAGNVYVTDNFTVRKITPAGVVTTLAGKAGVAGYVNGSGTATRFDVPTGIASDTAGNLYVIDVNNDAIRKITLTH